MEGLEPEVCSQSLRAYGLTGLRAYGLLCFKFHFKIMKILVNYVVVIIFRNKVLDMGARGEHPGPSPHTAVHHQGAQQAGGGRRGRRGQEGKKAKSGTSYC